MAQIIKATEIKTARRGRTAQRIPSVLAAMQSLKAGEALVLDEFGVVSEDEKSRIYQAVRAHWADVREDACRVSFDTESGYAVVVAKPSKGKNATK